MNFSPLLTEVSCSVEVFLATAMLHREQPGREDFTIQEIVSRAAKENIYRELRPGVSVHASQHCVANKAPNPANHRMLFATGKHTRRLLLPGDAVHPERSGRIFPDAHQVPARYLPVLEWARRRYESVSISVDQPDSQRAVRWLESLFELEGLGKEQWKDDDPDEFVRQLREGWE